MADQKITDLSSLGATPANDDVIPVVDISDTSMASTGTNKKVTVSNLLAGKADSSHTHTASDITDFDTEVANNTAVAANTAKVSNATHTGDATGSTALTVEKIQGRSVSSTAPTDGQVLKWVDSASEWQPATDDTGSGGGGGGSGTVTSVAISGSDGIDVDSGSPITSSGTIALGLSNIGDAAISSASTWNGKIANLSEDASPSLGGNLNVGANEINTSTSNGNIVLNPDGTGCVEVKGVGATTGAAGAIQLNCSNNNHGVKIQSPAHSAAADYTLTLPTSVGTAGQVLSTDGTTGDAALSWTTLTTYAATGNNSDITQLSGLTTAIAVSQGGTGATDASTARTNLGLGDAATGTIGSTVQGYDADTAKLDVDQSWTGSQRSALVTDNDGSFDMDAGQNFKCTPTAAVNFTFTNITDGQSGYILLVNGSAYTHTKATTLKSSSSLLTDIGAAGTFLVSYIADGTNVYLTNSQALS